ncbi:MAG: recombination-associated protein RdgC [Methylococcales symbiont of Iophon sp. n. MRB-2018]|nr:MAG: recombination-associated protein RdgC [Methylococcales symbiont of Iophon sp. n. MRB-2018]KAF3979559.1 MAG: recombination-associated protein RdgC [Methylococcales symbiont of Iophon sp. n. MRB-2018]
MWFKNLALYRFTEPFALTGNELADKLSEKRFQPCAKHDEFSQGWTSPVNHTVENLTHQVNGFIMLCLKKEEKVIPTAVINEMLQEKITEIEEQEGRKLAKKERSVLKDELIFELLPRAFSVSKKTCAYIDPKGGWLIVDAATAKKAEDLLSFLRKGLGSLPLVPINTIDQPISIMTQWLTNQASIPKGLTIKDECELRSKEDEGSIIRCKKHNLALSEITNHIDNGKQVIKIAINWTDRLSFIVDENLSIKRLKFLDLIQDQVADIETDNEAAQFDADFSIMSLELANFLPHLVEIFGGENKG